MNLEFFGIQCIYDEASPSEDIGRGAHYSVLRVPLSPALPVRGHADEKVRDVAVIWDEDHDMRVLEAIRRLHLKGLLSHALFIGERKGAFTLLVDGAYFGRITQYKRDLLGRQVANQVARMNGDHWQAAVGSFSPAGINAETVMESIIHADEAKVEAYLRRIGVKWQLGTRLAHDLTFTDKAWCESERAPRERPAPNLVPSWMVLEDE